MSAAQGRNGRAPSAVRVVIISTQYIETDPANFKSVVQRLTGKHSHRIHSHHELLPPPPKCRKLSPPPSAPSQVATSTGGVILAGSSSNNMNSSLLPSSSSSLKLSRGLSVSDLDRLQTLPSWEEISELCM